MLPMQAALLLQQLPNCHHLAVTKPRVRLVAVRARFSAYTEPLLNAPATEHVSTSEDGQDMVRCHGPDLFKAD